MTPGIATRTLIATAGLFWFADASLAALHWPDQIRSISQGVAVTTSVVAALLWLRDWETTRVARPAWTPLPERLVYASPHRAVGHNEITVRMPRCGGLWSWLRKRPGCSTTTTSAPSTSCWA